MGKIGEHEEEVIVIPDDQPTYVPESEPAPVETPVEAPVEEPAGV